MRRQLSLQKDCWASRQGVFFTPPHLADRLIRHIEKLRRLPLSPAGLVVLDPCCGDGALLHAARKTWPGARLIGFDITPPAEPFFEFHQLDFLAVPCPPLPSTLVLMNPPWGAQCAERHPWLRGEQDSAKNFVCAVLEKLQPAAMGLILPSAFLRQARHQDLRDVLHRHGDIVAAEDVGDGHFKGACAPAALLVWVRNASRAPCLVERLPESGKGPVLADYAEILDGGINYNRALCRELCLYHGNPQDAGDLPILRGADVSKTGIKHPTLFLRANWRRILAETSAKLQTKLFLGYSSRILCAPRILLRQTADRPICCVDSTPGGEIPLVGRSLLVLLPRPGVDPYVLARRLNSPQAAHDYQQLSGERGRPFAQVKVNVLKRIPVRL